MSDAKSPPDLSMDEILAQIRRIIAEDDQPAGPSTASTATSSGATARARTGSAASAGAGIGSGTDLATGDPAAGGFDRGAPAKDLAGDTANASDIVELTEAINEDGSVRHLTPRGSSSGIAALREPPPAPGRVEPDPEPQSASSRPDASSPSPVPEQAVAPDEKLVSDAASSAAAAAFARPSAPHEPPPQHELPLGAGGRTLEDIVRDLLKPMVQTWLDEHLAEIVERLVQAEIAGVGKSGPA
jgi:cell pole-organizing protein PopZ